MMAMTKEEKINLYRQIYEGALRDHVRTTLELSGRRRRTKFKLVVLTACWAAFAAMYVAYKPTISVVVMLSIIAGIMLWLSSKIMGNERRDHARLMKLSDSVLQVASRAMTNNIDKLTGDREGAVCPVCNGTGARPEVFPVVECAYCEGEGWVQSERGVPDVS